MSCICGLEKEYEECCGAIIEGKRDAKTPEELMRSRYSAYVNGDGAYLVFSASSDNRYNEDAELIEEFSNSVEWLKLEVLDVIEDEVEFKAYYRDKDGIQVLHERSSFVLEDDRWKYADGELFKSKVERNEYCPCGSGKKFKKCCS
jgi:SEC-C motif domain protein